MCSYWMYICVIFSRIPLRGRSFFKEVDVGSLGSFAILGLLAVFFSVSFDWYFTCDITRTVIRYL